MSIDLAQSLLKHKGIKQDELATAFASSYQWSRGYGPAAGKLLKKIKKGERWQDLNKAQYPEGSFGNGAAMRSPILGLAFFSNEEKMTSSVALSAEITHAHEIAIKGAKLIALAVSQAIIGKNNDEILVKLSKLSTISDYQLRINTCTEWLNTKTDISNKEIKKQLGNGIAANESVVSAIYFALSYKNKSFAAMIKQIQKLGGDTDTIAAMAGAIWGASNGYSALNQYDINNSSFGVQNRQ